MEWENETIKGWNGTANLHYHIIYKEFSHTSGLHLQSTSIGPPLTVQFLSHFCHCRISQHAYFYGHQTFTHCKTKYQKNLGLK